MDKQELYVAASRSREQTYLYATPEIQTHREEIAPSNPHLREGIPHIAEAAERDRAQLAAHEVALRSRFSGLPTEELVARRAVLEGAADREAIQQERRDALRERLERGYEGLDGYQARREAAEALPRRERKDELRRIDSMESASRRQLARLEAEMREMPTASDAARREFAVADQVLAGRRQLTITAARLSPPTYITKKLGERPTDPAKRKAWDRGVTGIESYRQENGIKGPEQSLWRGGETRSRAGTAARRDATAARDSASSGPGTARGENAPARARIGDWSMKQPRPTGD